MTGYCSKPKVMKKSCEDKTISVCRSWRWLTPKRAMRSLSQVAAAGLFFVSILPAGLCGEAVEGIASFYGREACRFNPSDGCPTASGKSLYDLEAGKEYFCASWIYPLKTKLRVTDIKSGKSVVCVVYDRGPAKRLGRIVDLSKAAFRKIADLKGGVIRVNVEVVK